MLGRAVCIQWRAGTRDGKKQERSSKETAKLIGPVTCGAMYCGPSCAWTELIQTGRSSDDSACGKTAAGGIKYPAYTMCKPRLQAMMGKVTGSAHLEASTRRWRWLGMALRVVSGAPKPQPGGSGKTLPDRRMHRHTHRDRSCSMTQKRKFNRQGSSLSAIAKASLKPQLRHYLTHDNTPLDLSIIHMQTMPVLVRSAGHPIAVPA